jgi:Integrase core domain
MADLGVTKTHSRPHVSDDNPYSESQFRTLKYRPGFPDRFGSIEDARGFCQSFFSWYNFEHHHSGLGLLTPAVVHLGKAADLLLRRQAVLDTAFQAQPGTLRPSASQTTFSSYCRLDQQAIGHGEYSLNFHVVCLIFIDTHRDGSGPPVRMSHEHLSHSI